MPSHEWFAVFLTSLRVAAAEMSYFDLISSVQHPSAIYIPCTKGSYSSSAVTAATGAKKTKGRNNFTAAVVPPLSPRERSQENHRHAGCLKPLLSAVVVVVAQPTLRAQTRDACGRNICSSCPGTTAVPRSTIVLEAGGEGRSGRQSKTYSLIGRCSHLPRSHMVAVVLGENESTRREASKLNRNSFLPTRR